MFTANGVVNLGVKNAPDGWATGINDASQVVGFLEFEKPFQAIEAFLYQNGVMTVLGYPVPTIGYSLAYAINNNGLIVGTAQLSPGEFGSHLHAASYANGTWTDLGTLGSGQNSTCVATSVNDSGAIVGRWADATQFGIFIYQNGNMTDLHAPTASNRFVTPIINNAGQIIYGKFIYQNGVWQDINTLIEPGGAWRFTGATAINNNGAIVGFLYNASQRINRAGLLTPVSSSQQAAPRKP
jgi:probable HAF family extracellular repeat protein